LQNAAEDALVWVKGYKVSRQYPTQKFTVPFAPLGDEINLYSSIPLGDYSLLGIKCLAQEQNKTSHTRVI